MEGDFTRAFNALEATLLQLKADGIAWDYSILALAEVFFMFAIPTYGPGGRFFVDHMEEKIVAWKVEHPWEEDKSLIC